MCTTRKLALVAIGALACVSTTVVPARAGISTDITLISSCGTTDIIIDYVGDSTNRFTDQERNDKLQYIRKVTADLGAQFISDQTIGPREIVVELDGPADSIQAVVNTVQSQSDVTSTSASAHFDRPADFITSPHVEHIVTMMNSGVSQGWCEGNQLAFRPQEHASREAVAAFLYRNAGSPAYTPDVKGFRDIPVDHPFADAIGWMKTVGISTGWDDGTFRPTEKVTREAMAAFLYRLAGWPNINVDTNSKPPFTDVLASSPFADAITWTYRSEISRGWSDGTFRPNEPISREALAAFLYRQRGVDVAE